MTLVSRTRALLWHHSDTLHLIFAVCFSSTMCCILSPLCHSASSSTFELAHMLNTHAYANAPATHQPVAAFASHVPSLYYPSRRAFTAELLPLINSSMAHLLSCGCLPTNLSSIFFNSSTTSLRHPALFTERLFTFAPERPVALAANRSVAIRASLATALQPPSAEAVVPPRRISVLRVLSTMSLGASAPPPLTFGSVAVSAMPATALHLPSAQAVA
mmetsp:Transcript_46517/g.101059  ORF Transcript_46517/g.101059 Transcript_46517/m.101059 type:complete len:217 (+) Transcript_46517:797-1447(+)